jgi:peptidyl-tRNA hydrolase
MEFPTPFSGIKYSVSFGTHSKFKDVLHYIVNLQCGRHHLHNFAVDVSNREIHGSQGLICICIQRFLNAMGDDVISTSRSYPEGTEISMVVRDEIENWKANK